jgi:hypothetical protein
MGAPGGMVSIGTGGGSVVSCGLFNGLGMGEGDEEADEANEDWRLYAG